MAAGGRRTPARRTPAQRTPAKPGPAPAPSSNDLTETRAARALARLEQTLAHSQRVAHLGNWEWDPASDAMLWSDEAYRILGIDPDGFIATGWNYVGTAHPEDQDSLVAATRAALKSGGRFSFDHRIVRPNGEIRHVHSEGDALERSRGRVLRMAGIIQDVTARQRDARRLAAVNHRLERTNRELDIALATMRQGLALFDAERRLVLWNQAYADLYRFGPGRLAPGMALAEVLESAEIHNALSMAISAEVMRERLSLAESTARETFLQHLPDGRVIEGLHQPLAEGGLVATLLDVTERERRERELLQAKETAEVANRAKSEFLATMSHELRTPLNAIIGFADLLAGEVMGPLEPRYRAYAGDIAASGQHLLGIINSILDMSKIEAGRFELNEGEFVLTQAARAALRVVSGRAKEAEIDLVSEIPDHFRLRADERASLQILVNLLSNAVKFTPAGGRVKLSATASNEGLAVCVTDSGIGISQKNLDKALQPFGQIDSSLARRFEGTGLGLPLVKSLIELHGGRLILESELGRGTKVSVIFPPQRLLKAE